MEILGWIIASYLAVEPSARRGHGRLRLDTHPEQNMEVVVANKIPETGLEAVSQGKDENGRISSPGTRSLMARMAALDVLVNDAGTARATISSPQAVDGGCGLDRDPLNVEELAGTDRVLVGLPDDLSGQLTDLLTAEKIASLAQRCARLHLEGMFPGQRGAICPRFRSRCSKKTTDKVRWRTLSLTVKLKRYFRFRDETPAETPLDIHRF